MTSLCTHLEGKVMTSLYSCLVGGREGAGSRLTEFELRLVSSMAGVPD